MSKLQFIPIPVEDGGGDDGFTPEGYLNINTITFCYTSRPIPGGPIIGTIFLSSGGRLVVQPDLFRHIVELAQIIHPNNDVPDAFHSAWPQIQDDDLTS